MKLGKIVLLTGFIIVLLSIWDRELFPIGIIIGVFGLGLTFALGMAEIENPPLKCRRCGSIDNPAITYEHNMVCRKCVDELLVLQNPKQK